MTALQFLQDARVYIDKPHKWTKYTLKSPFGAVCSLGALRETFVDINGHLPSGVTENNEWLQGDILAAGKYLAEALGVGEMRPSHFFSYIANYNDTDGVTHADVMAMWDRAIELAKADEEIQGISVADLIDELAPA